MCDQIATNESGREQVMSQLDALAEICAECAGIDIDLGQNRGPHADALEELAEGVKSAASGLEILVGRIRDEIASDGAALEEADNEAAEEILP